MENKKNIFSLKKLLSLVFLTILVFVFSAYTIYFLICMIPTIVASIVDRGTPRTLGITVGVLNFAGSISAWFDLIGRGQDIEYAFYLVLQPSTLLIAYGAAGIGWLIYFFVARFVAVIVLKNNKSAIKKINKKQQKLIERWGERVKY